MNPSFDDLENENQRLKNQLNFANKCLDVLIRFKINVINSLEKSSDSETICLTANDIQSIYKLDEEYNQLLVQLGSENTNNGEYCLIGSTIESSDVINSNDDHLIGNQQIITVSTYGSVEQFLEEKQKTSELNKLDSKSLNSWTVSQPITRRKSVERDTHSRLKQKSEDKEGVECIVILKSGTASEVHRKRLLKCTLNECNERFANRPTLVCHQKDCHKEFFTFKCSHQSCNKVFRFESKLNRHIQEVHNKRTVKCPVDNCSQGFETTVRLMSHQKECHKHLFGFQCSVDCCESIFRYKTELIRHLLEVHKKLIKCPISGCNYETNQRIELRVHQQKCHKKKSNIKRYVCSYDSCESGFQSVYRLKRHVIEVHINERRFNCDFSDCGKSFKTGNALKVHQIIHSSETPFKCQFQGCDYSAKSIHRLKLHQRIHSNDRPFICEFNGCPERFKTKLTLHSHMNTHSNESPVLCPIDGCGKYFRPHTLRTHVLSHSKQVLSCDWPECMFKTNGANKLRAHHKLKHMLEKNFVCEWSECGKRFKTNHQLRLHNKIHTNDKPYVCQWPGCEYRSSYSTNIRIHSRIHFNEKPFVCQWPGCDYRCAVSGNLRKHMKIHDKRFQLTVEEVDTK